MNQIAQAQARNLRRLLQEQGLTQKEFGEMLGFAPTTVNRWVKGKTAIRSANAELIHNRWPQYSVEWLQGGMDAAKKSAVEWLETSDALELFARLSGYRVELAPSDEVIFDSDGQLLHVAAFVVSKRGKSATLSDTQWSAFIDEVRDYVDMRLGHIIERGEW